MKSADYLFYHTHKNHQNKIPAYLDDLAYLTDALTQLNIATADSSYLHKAKEILTYVEKCFFDEKDVLFNYANNKFPHVSIVKKETYDGALPSSNAILCRVFYHLGYMFHNSRWTEYSQTMLTAMLPQIASYPTSFGVWALSLMNRVRFELQVVMIGDEAKTYIENLYNKRYVSNVLFAVSGKKEDSIEELRGKYDERGTRIFVCKNNTCLSPFTSIEDAMAVIF